MKQMIKSILIITVGVLVTSCKKDKEDPTIAVHQPVNGSEHTWGSEMHVQLTFEDDRELASYHIHLGNEAGDHVPEFDLEFQDDISGLTYDFHEHVIVPDSIEHEYYLHAEVVDAEGKSASAKVQLHFTE